MNDSDRRSPRRQNIECVSEQSEREGFLYQTPKKPDDEQMRLAYLAPDVLEKLLIHRVPPALSLNDLMAVAGFPWAEQMGAVFGNGMRL